MVDPPAASSNQLKHADEYAVIECGTTQGDITVELYRAWSPHGYDRAVHLFEQGFYDDSHFYRVVPHFLVQFGITYNNDLKPEARKQISDDPTLHIPFERGTVSYAGSGPNSRTSQLFFAYGSSKQLGTQLWETPVGLVTAGMEHVEAFYSYGDMPPWGHGPVQGEIHNGPQYIEENFPKTDRFKSCHVHRLPPGVAAAEEKVQQVGGEVDEKEEANRRELKSMPVQLDTSKMTQRLGTALKQKQDELSEMSYPSLLILMMVLGGVAAMVAHQCTKRRKIVQRKVQ